MLKEPAKFAINFPSVFNLVISSPNFAVFIPWEFQFQNNELRPPGIINTCHLRVKPYLWINY